MKVSEEKLLESGFTVRELQKLQNNIDSFGGTMEEVIKDLANRFTISIYVISSCLAVFALLIMFGSSESIFSGSIGLLFGIAVAIFVQPPVNSYKSWRYRRLCRN